MAVITQKFWNEKRSSDHSPAGLGTPALLAAAARRDGEACHALGVAYSTAGACMRDLIEAHKWFNLGALNGHEESAWCRSDIAAEMTRGEIAEAQRRAREWLGGEVRRAA